MTENKVYYLEQVIDILESNGWSVTVYDDELNCQRYSPVGQDFNVTFSITDDYCDFVQGVHNVYDEFDVSYETYLWLDSSGHGTNGAPYDMMDVYNDMQECENMLLELWEELKVHGEIAETAEEFEEE